MDHRFALKGLWANHSLHHDSHVYSPPSPRHAYCIHSACGPSSCFSYCCNTALTVGLHWVAWTFHCNTSTQTEKQEKYVIVVSNGFNSSTRHCLETPALRSNGLFLPVSVIVVSKPDFWRANGWDCTISLSYLDCGLATFIIKLIPHSSHFDALGKTCVVNISHMKSLYQQSPFKGKENFYLTIMPIIVTRFYSALF